MNFGNQKKNKEMKFCYLFLHLIQVINTKQFRITLKPLREIMFKDLREECLESLLLSKEYRFGNINKSFTLKIPVFCKSFNVIYVAMPFFAQVFWKNILEKLVWAKRD